MKRLLTVLFLVGAAGCPSVRDEGRRARELREQRDAALIAQLRAIGSDVSRPHHFVHHFVAPTRESARALADAAKRKGYEVSDVRETDAAETTRYAVDAMHDCIPELKEVQRHSETMANLAARFDADYDGWSTEVVRPED